MTPRPAGVVVAAIVLGLGTLLLLLSAFGSGVMTVLAPHLPMPPTATGTPPPPPGFLLAMMLLSTVVYLALAAWSGTTLVGLVRMRSWARVSAMIIGGCLVAFGLLGAAGMGLAQAAMASMPLPPGVDHNHMRAVFLLGALFLIVIAAVGVWWLVYFALRRTRNAFRNAAALAGTTNTTFRAHIAPAAQPAGPFTDFTIAQPIRDPAQPIRDPAQPIRDPAPPFQDPAQLHGSSVATGEVSGGWPPAHEFVVQQAPTGLEIVLPRTGRPVSMTVTAIFLLIGSFLSLLQMASPTPIFFLSVVLSGWPAHLVMLMWCAVGGVAGLGLIKLQKPAWVLALGVYCLTALNGLAVVLPGSRERFVAYMQMIMKHSSMGMPAPMFPARLMFSFMAMGAIFAVLFAIVMLILLWRARWAYNLPARDDQAAA